MSLDEVYDEFLSSSEDDNDDDFDEHDELLSDDDDGFSHYPSPVSVNKQDGQEAVSQKPCSVQVKESADPVNAAIKTFRESGDAKKLTVEHCKAYLRKHGLRVTGTKDVLVGRITEHIKSQGGDDFENSKCAPDISESFNSDAELVQIFAKMGSEEDKKVTIDQCKSYLRKHGLRLTGTKAVLIERIQQHVQLQDESGITKYPESTFTINCQGDACIGDVVLFKQRVYEKFNVGGRCSIGPPLGVRTVAGRIIKESYGSAKQQHTFTVEIMWSTGERPLPPLHPLIIKGRNLYRVKTLRQPWPDEEARKRQLDEKHSRGAIARMERKARIEAKKNFKYGIKRADRDSEHANRIKSSDDSEHILMKSMQALNLDLTTTHIPGRKDNETNNIGISEVVVDESYTELRLNAKLAGLIIGKLGANSKEIIRVSEADLKVESDPLDSSVCIVKIRGTSLQKNVALKMLSEKVSCRFFARGGCRHGDSCKFSHSLIG